ncbi:hypothetical protein FQN55_000758 [Onygenales sp. PD_40]|nr:hypothetical protein FQN55_000758 [Onygenales sp. PD_40]
MAGVPRIELWEENQPRLYANSTPYDNRPSFALPSSIFDDLQPLEPPGRTLKKSRSDTGMRKGFWSKLKRNKSEDQRNPESSLSPYYRPGPQQARAMASVKLVWSHERQIWMFPVEPEPAHGDSQPESNNNNNDYNCHCNNSSSSGGGYGGGGGIMDSFLRTEPFPRPRSAVSMPSTSSPGYGDEMLFGQLPGHYALSIYDSVNNEDSLPTYSSGKRADDVATRSGTESQWTLVARRVSGSAASM